MAPIAGSAAAWRTSSHSGGQGECVEVRGGVAPDAVGVRDSKAAGGPILTVATQEWKTFVNWLGRPGG
nr:DUF397 domain-containing protein [Streptomyces aidingensis]